MRLPRSFALLVLIALSSCIWRGYAEVMRVHLDVLAGIADKAAGNAAAGQRPSSNDVTELTYPMERAQQFVAAYRNDAERESYRRFVAALAHYRALVDAIDAARGQPARWDAARPEVAALYQSWQTAADQVRAALAREH
jgi:hypothetical protein